MRNDAVGYGKAARAAFVYGGGTLTLDSSELHLPGVRAKPTHGAWALRLAYSPAAVSAGSCR